MRLPQQTVCADATDAARDRRAKLNSACCCCYRCCCCVYHRHTILLAHTTFSVATLAARGRRKASEVGNLTLTLVKFWVCTEYLRWDVRRKALMEVVRELDADILCLQEVDNYLHFWVKEHQLLGYTGELLL